MTYLTSALSTVRDLVIFVGAGIGAWGVVVLLDGYSSDSPGQKSQGIKMLMAGVGIILIAPVIPYLRYTLTLSGAGGTYVGRLILRCFDVVSYAGAGIGAWGFVSLMEGYGNDSSASKSQGIKQLMAGLGMVIFGRWAGPEMWTMIQVFF